MHLLAALTLCTRLPLWRWFDIPKEAYEHVTDYWPFVGWVTGGAMASVLFLAQHVGFSPAVAALLTMATRLLLTGALHEDGLADCADGFGGGTTRERTLAIMKDSHIGTYGVVTLILYFAFLWTALMMVPPAVVLLFDVLGKVAASFVTSQLPYARAVEHAKVGVVYLQRPWCRLPGHIVRCMLALSLPAILVPHALILLPVPFVAELLMVWGMRRRLGGYTGDCCGALFLLAELSLYLSFMLWGG